MIFPYPISLQFSCYITDALSFCGLSMQLFDLFLDLWYFDLFCNYSYFRFPPILYMAYFPSVIPFMIFWKKLILKLLNEF